MSDIIATVGRRKRAIARVRMTPGKGKIVVNKEELANIDPIVNQPLVLTGAQNKFNFSIKVLGGGLTGQKEAIRHGIARALVESDPDNRKILKKAGLLTRDAREKERKKPGLKKARRAPQWQKR
ncbi:30S ribosomal protein S9 [Candidatus Berkelbacteria bacterium]|nr:30S ribosomal protein S9 [Candidatus Berkelbacteria bacterium]